MALAKRLGEICIERSLKGLYSRALAGEVNTA